MKTIITATKADTPNKNGVIYPRQALENAVKDKPVITITNIAEGFFTPGSELKNTVGSARVTIDESGNVVLIDCVIIDPLIEQLLNDGTVGIGMRGYGSVNDNKVGEDYRFECANICLKENLA